MKKINGETMQRVTWRCLVAAAPPEGGAAALSAQWLNESMRSKVISLSDEHTCFSHDPIGRDGGASEHDRDWSSTNIDRTGARSRNAGKARKNTADQQLRSRQRRS